MYLNVETGAHTPSAKWAFRLGFLMAAYIVTAAALFPIRFESLVSIYASKFLIGIPVLFVGGVCTAALINGREEPLRYAANMIRNRWVGGLLIMLFFYFSLIAFNAYKLAIPHVVPYYADQWLADADEWIHGTAPWELAHRLDSPIWSAIVLNCYEVIWFFQWFGMVLFVALWSDRTAGVRYLWAAALTLCILGTFMATSLASVGPLFYSQFLGEHRFAGLKLAFAENDYAYMVREPREFLLNTYRSGRIDAGGGISAMPSLHVAFVTLNAYFLSSLDRRLGVVGWAFAALIFYGSVYTGWHYAVDGYVSFAMVSLFWWSTGRIMQAPDIGGVKMMRLSAEADGSLVHP